MELSIEKSAETRISPPFSRTCSLHDGGKIASYRTDAINKNTRWLERMSVKFFPSIYNLTKPNHTWNIKEAEATSYLNEIPTKVS